MFTTQKGTPLSKKEVNFLLDLINRKPILTNKNTKASINQLKRDAWEQLTEEFNAENEHPRPKDQLHLKWANLKKSFKKKAKSSSSKEDITDNDSVMERVASLLNGTDTNFEMIDVTHEDVSDTGSYSIENDAKNMITDRPHTTEAEGNKSKTKVPSTANARSDTPKKHKWKYSGVRKRNHAMAQYFEKKTEKVGLEIKLLKLELLNRQKKLMEDFEV